ncbi:tetratricopeptide repeat protein [Candidatus Shapirobacteria bacterium]|nr:tetratricopeptide repeat protein [Candidatus Shapirobacteria bacterium]
MKKITLILASILAAVTVVSFVLVLTAPQEEKPIISPVAKDLVDNYSPTPDLKGVKTAQAYIDTAQQFLVRAEELSRNQNQNEEDKRQILTFVQKALETISEGLALYPQDDRLWAQRAKIYQGIASFTPQAEMAALADLEQARQLSPQNPNYPKNQSYLWAKNGNYQNAVYYANLAYQLDPTDLNLLKNLAQLQAKAGQVEGAIKTWQKLSLLLPQNDPSWEEVNQEVKTLENLLAQAKKEKGSQLQLAGENLNQRPIGETIPLEIQLSPQEQARLSQNLIIAAPTAEETISIEAAIDPNATAGEAVIPAGEKEVKIANNKISNRCSIYLAPQDDLENHLLFLKSKDASEGYFTAALNNPLGKDVKFKWWIIE